MAYAFNAINKSLGLDDEGRPLKTDIFGGGSGGGGSAGPASGGGSPPPIKSTTEGSLGGGGGSAPAPGQSPSPSLDQQQTSASRAAIRAASGKTFTPKAFHDAASTLTSQDRALQDEADSYMAGERSKQAYGATTADIEGAIKGDTEAFGRINSLLGKRAPDAVTEFKPTTAVGSDDISKLRSDAGLAELVRRGQGPSYSQGMAAFDVQALRGLPGFEATTKMLEGQQEALRQKRASIGEDRTKAAQDYAASQLAEGQKGVKDYLGAEAQKLDKANAAEAAAANAKLDKLKASGRKLTTADVRKVLLDLTKEFGEISPRTQRFVQQAAGVNITGDTVSDLAAAKIDPGNYQKFRDTPYESAAFWDPAEAARFNAISALLGKGDTRTAAAGGGAADTSFDAEGYRGAVREAALKGRADQDVVNKADIEAIKAAAQQRADELDKGWLGIDSASEARRLAEIERAQLGVGDYGIDPTAYYRADTRDLLGKDVLTAEEAARLNDLAKDTGLDETYAAGTAAQTSQAAFDRDAYRQALLEAMRPQIVDPRNAAIPEASRPREPSTTEQAGDEIKKAVQTMAGIPFGARDAIGAVGSGDRKDDIYGGPGDVAGRLSHGIGEASNELDRFGGALGGVGRGIGGALASGAGNIANAAKTSAAPVVDETKRLAGTLASGAKGVGGAVAEGAKGALTGAQKSTQLKADPVGVLRDLLTNGKNSKFYGSGPQDIRNLKGFAESMAGAGIDANTAHNLITQALNGKISKSQVASAISGAKATAKKGMEAKAAKATKLQQDLQAAKSKVSTPAAPQVVLTSVPTEFPGVLSQLEAARGGFTTAAQAARDKIAAEVAAARGGLGSAAENLRDRLSGFVPRY